MKTLIDLSKVFRPIAKRRTRCCNEWFLVFAQLHDWFEGIDEPLNPSKFSSNSQKRDFFSQQTIKLGWLPYLRSLDQGLSHAGDQYPVERYLLWVSPKWWVHLHIPLIAELKPWRRGSSKVFKLSHTITNSKYMFINSNVKNFHFSRSNRYKYGNVDFFFVKLIEVTL